MKSAAIYTRVSSEQQKEEQTIESQVVALQEYAQANGYVVCEQWVFRDEGYSGATLVRPGLEAVRDLAAEGQIEAVLVYGPDRLSRRYAYQVLLLEEFARNGVEVVFLRSPQATTPEEELLLQFQGMIAEYERAQITERTRRGKRHRARCGLVNVLCGAPYGYRYVRKTETTEAYYELIDSEAEVVREVYRLYTEQGVSIGDVVRRLNAQGTPTRKGRSAWERTTVWAMLRNPAYKGRACFGKTGKVSRSKITRPLRNRGGFSKRCSANRERPREEWIEIPVPAIISEETFALAQERLQRNKQLSARRTKEPTLLQGMLVCQRCGYAYYRCSTRTSRRKIYYYRCLGSDHWRYPNGAICDSRPIRQDYLDAVVWDHVVRLLEEPALLRSEIDRRLRDITHASATVRRKEAVESAQRRVSNSIDKMLDAYQEGLIKIEELRRRLPELRKRQQTLEAEHRNLQMQAVDEQMVLRLAENLDSFLSRLRHSAQSLNVTERQRILRLVAKEILVDRETVTIKHSIPAGNGPEGASPPSYLLCKGSDDPALRCAFFGFPQLSVFHHALAQERLHQGQDPPVGNPLFDPSHELGPRDRVEVASPIGFHHVPVSRSKQAVDFPQRVFTAASGPKPVTAFRELPFEDRFHYVPQRGFHRSVPDRRDAQRALLPAPRLRYVPPPDRLGPVRAVLQRPFQPLQLRFLLVLELLDGDVIDPRRAPVGSHLAEGRPQVLAPVHLVHQAIPLASFPTRFECFQHPVCPHRGFHPRPPGADLSGLRSPCGHSRRCSFPRCVHPVSPFLAVLRSVRITGLPRYYAASDFPAGSHPRRDLPASRTRPSDRSVTQHPWRPAVAFARYPSAQPAPPLPGSGLHQSSADSPRFRPFCVRHRLSYGPVVHLPLLPTRRRRRCSYVRLRAGERMPGADFHRSERVRSQAHVVARFSARSRRG